MTSYAAERLTENEPRTLPSGVSDARKGGGDADAARRTFFPARQPCPEVAEEPGFPSPVAVQKSASPSSSGQLPLTPSGLERRIFFRCSAGHYTGEARLHEGGPRRRRDCVVERELGQSRRSNNRGLFVPIPDAARESKAGSGTQPARGRS